MVTASLSTKIPQEGASITTNAVHPIHIIIIIIKELTVPKVLKKIATVIIAKNIINITIIITNIPIVMRTSRAKEAINIIIDITIRKRNKLFKLSKQRIKSKSVMISKKKYLTTIRGPEGAVSNQKEES